MIQLPSASGTVTLELKQGDITRENVEAIVNAANSSLLGGGGVDGAIHRAGGPEILAECRQIREMQGPCAAGQAVITGGGKLAAKYVIHTVGPIWREGTTNEEKKLSDCYRNSLQLAVDYQIASIAFPSISTGAYGYPLDLAAPTALLAVQRFVAALNQEQETTKLQVIRFVLFDPFTLSAYQQALKSLVLA